MDRPIQQGFFQTHGVLECISGHLITKYKKLKPWQGLVAVKRCGVCTVDIHRNQFRWRCKEHCDYNICEECYNDHYLSLIEKASQSDNPKKREKMLSAIPQHLQLLDEYVTAKNWVPPPPPPPEENGTSASSTDNAKPKKVKGSKTPIPGPQPELALAMEKFTNLPDLLKVAIWSTIWLAGMLLLGFAVRAIMLDEELAFPNAWILVGLGNGVSFVICEVAVFLCLRYGRLGHAVDIKGASCFGVMHSLQLSLSTAAIAGSDLYHNVSLMGYTVALGLIGILAKTEKPTKELILALVFVGVGGMLSVSSQGGYTLGGLFGTNVLVCQLPSLLVGTSRLVLTSNFLNFDVPNQRHGKHSPLILAAHMMPGTALASLELGFITDYSSYTRLLQMPYKVKVAERLLIIGVGYAIVNVAEMQLLQMTSVTLMGLLIPCSCVCFALASSLTTGTITLGVSSIMLISGVVLTILAFVLYLMHRKHDVHENGEENGEENGYRRLEGNDRERRHRSKRHRREREESLSPRTTSTHSPRSPGQPPQAQGEASAVSEWL